MIDVVLVGGGLANCLIALRLEQLRPELSLRLVEREPELCGQHTWSFHAADIAPAARARILALATQTWAGYDVRFPDRRRTLGGTYASIRSESLRAAVLRLGGSVLTGRAVAEVRHDGVTLEGGEVLAARAVIDGRGWPDSNAFALGYQKFLGLDVALHQPHGLTRPTLMDANVEQHGGFRFIYLLPWGERRVLIEDTLYADSPELDVATARAGALEYARDRGWEIASVEREERGVLPIPLGGDVARFLGPVDDGIARSGLRGALFHATTGYSLPAAVAFADALAALPNVALEGRALRVWQRERSLRHWRGQGFLRLLNRMLFRAATPSQRYRVLERFYGLSEALIERFYAGRLTGFDRLRLLSGRPPVPVLRALACLREPRPVHA